MRMVIIPIKQGEMNQVKRTKETAVSQRDTKRTEVGKSINNPRQSSVKTVIYITALRPQGTL